MYRLEQPDAKGAHGLIDHAEFAFR